MITFTKSVKVAKEGSQWQLMTEADNANQANLFIRIGKNGQPLSVSASNVLGVTDKQLDTWINNGTISVGPLFPLLEKASQDYPDYKVTTAFKKGAIRVFIDAEEVFGFHVHRDQYVILDAHGDEGAEYYRWDGLEYRIKELFKQAKQLMLITSFTL